MQNPFLSSQPNGEDEESNIPTAKSHPSFHIYANHTLLGQSLIEALNELYEPNSSIHQKALQKFEEAYLQQFENMSELVPEPAVKVKTSQENSQTQSSSQKGKGGRNRNSEKVTRKESLTNMFGGESEESTAGNAGGSGSYISQATSHLVPKNQQKLNLNKNKVTASCKEYKNIDDEWLFHCDNIKIFEVQDGNVFHNPSIKYDVESIRQASAQKRARKLRQKILKKTYQMQHQHPYPAYGGGTPMPLYPIPRGGFMNPMGGFGGHTFPPPIPHHSPSPTSHLRSREVLCHPMIKHEGAMPSFPLQGTGANQQQPHQFTGGSSHPQTSPPSQISVSSSMRNSPGKLIKTSAEKQEILPGKLEGFLKRDIKNVKVHLVPSSEFIAHVKKRSRQPTRK